MAETAANLSNLPPELELILNESKHRWLRPAEILQILSNHQRFKLTEAPPCRPSAGSLFLFNRKSLRYFRNDGHRWRKKRDGKTVREAHEKLKVGSMEVLHCYYAHGDDDENFQRRCYWKLDETLDHIVLVHYQHVKRGHKSAVSHLQHHPSSQFEGPQSSSASFAQRKWPAYAALACFTPSQNRTDCIGQTLSTEIKDWDARNDLGTSFLIKSMHDPVSHDASFLETQVEGFPMLLRNAVGPWSAEAKFDHESPLPLSSEICIPNRNVQGVKTYVCQSDGFDFNVNNQLYSNLESEKVLPNAMGTGDRLSTDADNETTASATRTAIQEHELNFVSLQWQNSSDSQTVAAFNTTETGTNSKVGGADKNESGQFKQLEHFERWMDKEIGGDCGDPLMASESDNYWNTLCTENDDKNVSSLSHHMQLHIDLLGPSLSQEQLFSIRDFSPEWAYSNGETKVIIIGTFLGSKKFSREIKWGCMFGEIEVPAEVLADNVIRCQAPRHAAGRIPFYITCRNRLACSEVREFEYRENPSANAFLLQDELLRFQIRLARLLYLEPKTKLINCSIQGCDRCKPINTLYTITNGSNSCDPRDKLIENLLRDRLGKWLIHKFHEESKGPDVLDEEGQGVIHLAACLDYEWALDPIVAASGTPNFRDSQGRTALHWASYFGREEAVIALIRLGADPTAVDDPTSAFPAGCCAADLASTRGHKGIAAYLGEAFLEKLLSSLNIEHDVIHKKDSKVADHFSVSSNGGDVQRSLKGSLAALNKSAHAAALIQAAYRSYSFHQRQLFRNFDDMSEVSFDLAALGYLNNAQRRGHHEEYLHLNTAALKIQRKYKSWKGRKEFLKMRNRIVKMQAHVRGHQVRKQYKKVVWSVGILEKIILRWRRKQAGLRGFRVESTAGVAVLESDGSDEYEFLRISRNQKRAGVEKALARVKSMVHNEEAWKQYMRLVAKFKNLQMADQESSVLWQGEASESVQKNKEEYLFCL